MVKSRTVLVTGANRGIGFSIVQALATKSPQDTYLLACRDATKGQAAIEKFKSLGIAASLNAVELDIDSDTSIANAVKLVEANHGKLDVLVNNAGIARVPKTLEDTRQAYNETLTTNVTSVAVTTIHFLPLLRKSESAMVINVSSARGSLTRSALGKLPPTILIAYNASKSALNMVTLEQSRAKENEGIRFHSISPGHCKTEFNGYRGVKDPLDGAKVVVELMNDKEGKYPSGFWEMEGEATEPTPVEW